MIRAVECPECQGRGDRWVEQQLIRCERCDGHGRVYVDFGSTRQSRGLLVLQIVALVALVVLIWIVAANRRPATSEVPRDGTPVEVRTEASGAAVPLGAEVGTSRTPAADVPPSPAVLTEILAPIDGPSVSPQLDATVGGIAAYAKPSFGSRYLALPEGPGVRVRICSSLNRLCLERISTDAGPDLAMQRAGRVADVSYVDFRALCGCTPEVKGTMRVSIEYGRGSGPTVTLPPTDVGP